MWLWAFEAGGGVPAVVLALVVAAWFFQRHQKRVEVVGAHKAHAFTRSWLPVVPRTARRPGGGADVADDKGAAETTSPYHWGRYKKAVPLPDIVAPWWRLKQWHYHSMHNGRWFVGLAIANLGYVANAWVYLIDGEHPKPTSHEYRALVPLATGVSFASSSVTGTTTWKSKGNRIVLQADGSAGKYFLDIAVAIDGVKFEGSCAIPMPEESLALLYPLEGADGSRAAYTHKAAGMPVEGDFTWGEERIHFTESTSFATMDWTRSFAARETIWKWASFAGLGTDRRSTVDHSSVRIGLNLSAEVYDDQENALWLDGKVRLVGPVEFMLPPTHRLTQDKWTIRSSNGALQLDFLPYSAREEHLHVGIIASKFSQVGGLFSGTVNVDALPESTATAGRVIAIDGLLGVVETHYALW